MKKVLALVLGLFLILMAFVACAKEPGDESKAVSESQSSATSEPGETTDETSEESSKDHLNNPDIYTGNDYDGMTITFFTTGVGTDPISEFVYNEEMEEETLSATVNDAIKARNDLLYERLGVTVKEVYYKSAGRYGSDTLTKIYNYIQTSDSESFQVISVCLYDCGTLAMGNNLYDLNSLSNINMTNPWWEQSFNKSVTIADQLYFTLGDIGFNHKNSTPCVYYNYSLFDRMNLEDPIPLAVDGKWTIDAALQYSKNLCIDSEAPEGMDYKDQFGWAGQYDDMYAMLYGAGVRVLSPDPEGYPMLTLNTPAAVDTVDKVLTLMFDESYISGNDYFNVSSTPMVLLQEAFQEGRCLFYSGGINSASIFDMEDTFGILPVPKLSEDQDDYYSLINTWVTNAYGIAANCDEDTAEFAAAVLDVMGYYSWKEYPNSLSYNYYERMLKNQKLTREESESMLDLIFSARGCELGAIFQIGKLEGGSVDVNGMLQILIQGKVTGKFASTYGQYADKFESDVETLNNFFKENLN
ncbi:MAG: hypothetical protein GX148_02050 [Clostridiales bacterium]|nr:hypothetical protein [Clostridiales bacterium]